jgi:hypothetical protein
MGGRRHQGGHCGGENKFLHHFGSCVWMNLASYSFEARNAARDNADGEPFEGTPSALKDQDQIEIDNPIFLPTRPCFLSGPSRTPANRTFITFTG